MPYSSPNLTLNCLYDFISAGESLPIEAVGSCKYNVVSSSNFPLQGTATLNIPYNCSLAGCFNLDIKCF